MRHYYDVTLQKKNGLMVPAAGIQVAVFLQGTQTPATLFTDDGITQTLTPGVVFSDTSGQFNFYVANGRYDLSFTGVGFTSITQLNVEITDAMDLTALGKTPIAFTANNTHSGAESFTGALNPPLGATNPATCSPGAIFFNTASNSLQNCTATNTWSPVGSSSTNVPVTCAASSTFPIAATFITDFFMNLNCNVTSSSIGGVPTTGQEAVFTLVQDNVGGRTFAWPASFLNTPNLATAAGAATVATFQFCGSVGNGNACPANSWQNTDVGPTGIPLYQPNVNTVTVATVCGFTPNCFQVFADGQYVTDAVWTSGQTQVTSATASFQCPGGSFPCTSGGDAGKIVFGFGNNGTFATGQTTIATVTNATTIQLAVAAAASIGSAGILVWGHDDTTVLQNAYAALIASRRCQPSTFLLPSGYMLVQGHVGGATLPSNCATTVALNDNGSGITVKGHGAHSTKFIPTPNFSLAAAGDTGYFFSGGLTYLLDFGIWGGQQFNVATTIPIIAVQNDSYLVNIKIEGWQPATNAGISVGGLNCNNCSLTNVYMNDGGFINVTPSQLGITLVNTFCSHGLQTAGSSIVNDFGGFYNQGPSTSTALNIGASGGSGTIYNGFGVFVTGPPAGVAVRVGNSANVNFYGATIDGSGAGSFGIFYNGSGANVSANSNTIIKGNATNGAINNTGNNAGAIFHDDGTTQFTWGTASVFFGHAGSQFNIDANSLRGACTGVATASSTLGLYGTGPNVTLSTCTSAAIGTGQVMNGIRTLQGLVASASAAGVNASSGVVTVLKNGVATTITCTIGTGTSCNDFTHTVTTADGDLISLQFTTQAADTLAGVKASIMFR